MSTMDEFWSICAEAKLRLDVTFNAPDVVPYGARLVELIQGHLDLRDQFSDALVKAALDQERCDPWVVEFCAHALRWPELRGRFIGLHAKAVREDQWSKEPVLRHICQAFEDDWENARDFYGAYFGRGET
jgi:hypothetical protein